jgi:hypothetical protein
MLKRISILVLFVFFSCSSPVLAAGHHKKHKHPRPSTERVIAPAPTGSEDPIPLAEERAVAYWHATPCGGTPITVGFAVETPQFRAEETAAYGLAIDYSWSSWDSPTGANIKTASTSTYTDCAIAFNAEDWPSCTTTPSSFKCTYSHTWEAIDERWPTFCEAFIHEWGNLLGIPEESISGTTVMSQTGAAQPLPICS